MRILIATDAWRPQVNGVVRTLTSLARAAATLGGEIEFLTPDGFPSMQLPTYPGLRIALPNRSEIARRIEAVCAGSDPYRNRRSDRLVDARLLPAPQASLHHLLHHALSRNMFRCGPAFPSRGATAVLRRFHAAGAVTMVATNSLREELRGRGFTRLGAWTRGVDTKLFNPDEPAELDLPRPIFAVVGRVAVEKNLEAFLSLDLPGTKVVIGDGPQKAELERRFPSAKFLGEKTGKDLTSHIAAADVFVFPSLTDTFGVVQLEALACGTPVAAFPVTGPLDVIADHPIGALDTRSARRLSARADHVARDLPCLCAGTFLGEQREAVHRQSRGPQAGLLPRPTPIIAGSSPVRG